MRFEFATATRIIFGEGTAATLPELARSFGARPLVVTGASTERAAWLVSALEAETFSAPGEPTVELVRAGARRVEEAACDVILAMGGAAPSTQAKRLPPLPPTAANRWSFSRSWVKGARLRLRRCHSLPCQLPPAPAAK